MPEMTDKTVIKGWILYDGECPVCLTFARRFERMMLQAGFAMLPLQSPLAGQLVAGRTDDLLKEMLVITADGRMFGGADALLFLAEHLSWARPIPILAKFPGVRRALRRAYRWIAAHRYCAGGTCGVQRSLTPRVLRATAAILPILAFIATRDLAPWIVMWTMGAGIFFSGKCLMLARYLRPGMNRRQLFRYLFLWIGMDPQPFLNPIARRPPRPKPIDCVAPAAKLILGCLLLWFATPAVGIDHPIAAGWTGMVGMILVLHFGTFHFLALFWQHHGIGVQPLMATPFHAPSLTSFWGGRWNSAFNDVAKDVIYQPLWRRIGPAGSILVVFLVSGVVHDIVISIPAEGGYEWPTLYFLIQGLGLLAERSPFARRIGLARGIRGRLFLFTIAGLPLFWLFHPPFIHTVILPFLKTIHAL